MAVLSVNKMWSKDGWSVSTTEGLRKRAQLTTAYQIVVDPTTTELEISASGDLPYTGDPFPGLSQIFLKTRAFDRVSPILWIGTMNYEGEFGPEGPESPATAMRPIVSWTDTETDEAIDQDWDGNPIVTANGEPIEGVTMKIADNVLSVERNYRFFSPWLTSQYRHSVNSDVFQGYPAGTGRLVRFSAQQQWDENDNGFWKVQASIQFRYPFNTTDEKAWYARVRHEGYRVRGSDGRITLAVDDNKETVSKPVLLKEDGTLETDPNNAHWLEFKRYQPLPYNSLGLLD